MRKTWSVALVVLGVASLAASSDWPQFQGPDRTGVSSETGVLRAFPEGGPKVLWTVKLGVGYGGPAVQGGKVYVLDRPDDVQEVLRCWDLATGNEEWTCAYEAKGKVDHNGSRSTPAVDDKYVFTVGIHGHFHCISKETHKPVWSKHLIQDFGGKAPQWAVAQSPLLYKDMVIVAPQSATVGVIALERATGKEVWKSKSIGPMQYSSPLIAKVAGMDQVIMMNGKCVAGVDPTNGAVLWTFDGLPVGTAEVPAPTAMGDDRFFVSGGYNAGCAAFKVEKSGDKYTVKQLFKNGNVDAHIHSAILFKDHLYVLGNTNNEKDGLVCLDLDGKLKWKTGGQMFDKGGYILVDGVLYIMEGAGGVLKIVAPSPDGFKELSQAKLLQGREIWAPMALSDGKLLCRDQGQMKCLDIKGK